MIEKVIIVLALIVLAIAVPIAIARWIFRVNDMVAALRATEKHNEAIRQHLARVDYFLEQANSEGGR